MGKNGGDVGRLVSVLSGMQGFDEFHKGCSNRESLYDVADGFLLWKRQKGLLQPGEETTLKILREKLEQLGRGKRKPVVWPSGTSCHKRPASGRVQKGFPRMQNGASGNKESGQPALQDADGRCRIYRPEL